MVVADDDFSTNRYSPSAKLQDFKPSRHAQLCFDDGNIAILTDDLYFLVHKGLLSRHSDVLAKLVNKMERENTSCGNFIEGRPALAVQDTKDDMASFLLALYDGISHLSHYQCDFGVVAGILRLSTKYKVARLREGILRCLSTAWPKTLANWELREAAATTSDGHYSPRDFLPHPVIVINLAREVDAPELLPSAYYDLSRSPPSEISRGFLAEGSESFQALDRDDMMNVLRGREHTSRFFSTFVVNVLEGRTGSAQCTNANTAEPARRKTCRLAFESVTFELLRDINGVICKRSGDPLYAIIDAEIIQMREDGSGSASCIHRACEQCRREFALDVDEARQTFWQYLPVWFNVKLVDWNID